MNVKELENAEEWAVETFGAADLGDPRRTDRLVKMAAEMARKPLGLIAQKYGQLGRYAGGLPISQ